MNTRGRRPSARGEVRDAGMTLVEVCVAMAVFAVVTALFLSAVTSMSRTAVRTQNEADAAADLRRVYQQMDRQVRYADAINFPGLVGATQYVELRTSAVPGSGPTCHQWRVTPTSGELQLRSWPEGQTPGSTWRTLARTVTGPAKPFELVPADVAMVRARQALKVSLTTARGSASSRAEAQTTTLFVARNSSQASAGNLAVSPTSLASASPVCGAAAAVRP